MRRVSSILTVLVAACFISSAHAAVVTYHLQDVVFEDGGTASGSFVYDGVFRNVGVDTIYDIAMNTTTGSALDGMYYSDGFVNYTGSREIAFQITNDDPNTDPIFRILDIRVTNLTESGSFTSLISEYIYDRNFGRDGGIVSVRNGTGLLVSDDLMVSEVPVPAALPLFLAGLAGLAAVRRRQRSRAANAL